MLNTKFSKPHKTPMITLQTWLDLIESIPEEWIELVVQGNQRPPIPLEFCILPNYDSPHTLNQGDIYEYLPDGKLQYYSFPDPHLSEGVIYKNFRPTCTLDKETEHIVTTSIFIMTFHFHN